MCFLIEVGVYGVLRTVAPMFAIFGLQLLGVVTETRFEWWQILVLGLAGWLVLHGLFWLLGRAASPSRPS